MHTIWELIQHMSESSIQGIFGVAGIFIFFIAIILAAAYRVKEAMEKDEQHH